MIQVSVIVLTYNPDAEKLRRTLRAAVEQEDISLEIIVSDDGSQEKEFSFIPAFLRDHGIDDYQIIENKVNQGTVKNCLGAVKRARGEYVFLTSPGDYLFDKRTIHDFYHFARSSDCKLCFGNVIPYCVEDGKPALVNKAGIAEVPGVYFREASFETVKASYMGGNWVVGAGFFRERSFAQKIFEQIEETSVYMEDTTSTMFALADGVPLNYYDRSIVWYEVGSGISTGPNEKWAKLLNEDLSRSLAKLKSLYPNDPYVDVAYCNIVEKNRWKRVVKKLFRHPIVMMQIVLGRKGNKMTEVRCQMADIQRLRDIHNDVVPETEVT